MFDMALPSEQKDTGANGRMKRRLAQATERNGAVPLFVIAFLPAVIAVVLLRTAPRFTFVLWIVVVFFVPIWVGATAGYFFSAVTALTLLCLAAGSLRGLQWTMIDSIVLLFLLLIAASLLLGGVEIGHFLTALIDWIVPYAWGRMVLARLGMEFITSAIAAVTVVAAGLGLVEFATGTNVFTLIHFANNAYTTWSTLQARGGFLRAEGAFGHSIAFGAALSIGSVFTLAARWHIALRVVALAIIGGAIVVTLSRIGMVSFILGLVLSIAFLGRVLAPRVRALVAGLAILGAVVAVPFVSDVLVEAGSEAQGSALYRLDLLGLLSQMAPLGVSPNYTVLPNGQVYIGTFQSIDSELLLLGLQLGFVPLALVVIALIAAVVLLFTRANIALVALVSQIPTLATVALITQLPYLLWFVAGLGVSFYILENKLARTDGDSVVWGAGSTWRRERAWLSRTTP